METLPSAAELASCVVVNLMPSVMPPTAQRSVFMSKISTQTAGKRLEDAKKLAWETPTILRIEAVSAENGPPDNILDGPVQKS